jgi:hypothetical protein
MTRSLSDPTGDPQPLGAAITPPDADRIPQLPEEFRSGETVDFEPTERPRIGISTENDWKVMVVDLTGKLHKDDFRHFLPAVQRAVERHGRFRMLVRMHDFHGWDASALWEEVKFELKHFNDIERLAIVGETAWEKWMAMFCKPFTTAKIQYFPMEHADEARTWITQE